MGGIGTSSNGLDTNLQDQTTRPLFLPFTNATGTVSTIETTTVRGTNTIEVADTAGFTIGLTLGVFSGVGIFYFGRITDILVAGAPGIIQVALPFDDFYPAGAPVIEVDNQMAGTVATPAAPRIFEVRGFVGGAIDVTRLILTMITEDPIDYDGFGDGAPLEFGMFLRTVNGTWMNHFNIQDNWDLARVSYDVSVFEQAKVQDVNGLTMRLTFAGQGKVGVAVRLTGGNERLELGFQDDLTAGGRQILDLGVMAEGHIVT